MPLAYLPDGDRLLIFGSRAGSDKQPDWYWDLRKNSGVTVEVATEMYQARATPVEGEERDRLFAKPSGQVQDSHSSVSHGIILRDLRTRTLQQAATTLTFVEEFA